MLPVVIVVIGVRAEQLDLLVAHEAENEREDLHEHGDIRGEDEKPNVVRRHLVKSRLRAKPVVLPGVAKCQRVEEGAEGQGQRHENVCGPQLAPKLLVEVFVELAQLGDHFAADEEKNAGQDEEHDPYHLRLLLLHLVTVFGRMGRIEVRISTTFVVEVGIAANCGESEYHHDHIKPNLPLSQLSDLIVMNVRHCHVKAGATFRKLAIGF